MAHWPGMLQNVPLIEGSNTLMCCVQFCELCECYRLLVCIMEFVLGLDDRAKRKFSSLLATYPKERFQV
jgi:hypothetical protein